MKQCGFKAQLCYYNTAVRIIILFADFIKAPQSTSMKKFSSKSKISKILQLQQENEADLHAIRNGLKKHIIEEKGFVFSLSQFEEKNQEIKEANLNRVELAPHSLTQRKAPLDEQEEESKRKMIYGSESYKEKFEEGFSKQVEKNNHLFSMVFLGKSKLSQTPSISFVPIKDNLQTQRRSRAQKPSFQDPQPLKISDFELGKKLGAGKFGQVFIARHKGTNFMCALKKIQKQNVDSKVIVQVVRQIKIQSFLSHPNIVKMFAFFADKSYIYLVLQLCFSGQLYSFLKRRRRISEDTTKNIVQQVCRALDYMHENQIIHRDLKPENIIFHCGLVKICDFGWSISTNTMRDTFCGTPLYVSPEILKRKTYNNKIDVWSVGILTYELLFGRVPFEITTERDFLKIVRDQIRFSRATKISEEARHFISACLQKDPRDRFTLPELLEHPFLAHLENTSMLEMY